MQSADVNPTFSLASLGIVDAPPEEAFDSLTRLAQTVFQVPVSLVSIVEVDRDRQYFKSQCGLPEPWASQRQTPLSHSFCQHVAAGESPLVVEYAPEHTLVCDNLAIRDLNVIAYLGAPIRDHRNSAIGALCVIDGVPRKWTDAQIITLTQLAACVSDAIRLKAAVKTSETFRESQDRLIVDLKLANADLSQFAYVASHDLQEPLRKVISFCRLLRDDCGPQLAAAGAEYVEVIVDGATRMQQLIRDLLEYAQVDSRKVPLAEVSLQQAFHDALDNLQGAVLEAGAMITHDELPRVICDGRQLIRLLQNLIGNSIKYCQRTPQVHVRVADEGSHYVVAIQDNGIGIAAEAHDQVFGIFKRLHTRGDYPGTGIGLAICKRIVDRWQQRIWLESEVGVGTTFYFTLAKPDADAADPPHLQMAAT